jgi:hypothetical protein
MPIITAPFERYTFRVEAVRVTTANLEEIAEWCGGRVVSTEDYGWNVHNHGRKHIQVPTGPTGKGLDRAHLGNWVTCLVKAKSFRVYKEKSFLAAFHSIMSDTEKYAKVHQMLMQISAAQDKATYYQDSHAGVMLLVDDIARRLCEMM